MHSKVLQVNSPEVQEVLGSDDLEAVGFANTPGVTQIDIYLATNSGLAPKKGVLARSCSESSPVLVKLDFWTSWLNLGSGMQVDRPTAV